MASPCCPPNSVPAFADDYSPQGIKTTANSVEIYAAGKSRCDGKAIIIFPDIWGWDSGRTRRFADLLADVTDYVIVPKLLSPTIEGGTDDDGLPPNFDLGARPEVWGWLSQFSYSTMKPKTDELINYLVSKGISRIGILGFCYGGYLAAHVAAEYSDIVSCIVSPHPSIHAEEGLFGGNNLALAQRVLCPTLLLPAAGDPPSYLPGGEVFDAIVSNAPASKSILFPDMQHGFASRGDLSDPNTNRDVLIATELIVQFFREHLQNVCYRTAR